jgi:predicted membrane protein
MKYNPRSFRPTFRTKGERMSDTQTGSLNLKTIGMLILVAVITSVVVTLMQVWLMGKSNVAVTGGVVGALCVGLFLRTQRKPPTQ